MITEEIRAQWREEAKAKAYKHYAKEGWDSSKWFTTRFENGYLAAKESDYAEIQSVKEDLMWAINLPLRDHYKLEELKNKYGGER